MQEDLEKIKILISKPLNEKQIIVDSIVFEEEGKYKFLKITLDREGGLDMDSIVEATHIINPIVDKYNLSVDNYLLDISSKERNCK